GFQHRDGRFALMRADACRAGKAPVRVRPGDDELLTKRVGEWTYRRGACEPCCTRALRRNRSQQQGAGDKCAYQGFEPDHLTTREAAMTRPKRQEVSARRFSTGEARRRGGYSIQ